MRSRNVTRRSFILNSGLFTTAGLLSPSLVSFGQPAEPMKRNRSTLRVSTDFMNGGGDVKVVQTDPVVISIKPHNEKDGGYSQVWWHFLVNGFPAGKEIILRLNKGEPEISGISPQISFSYDQTVWDLTDTGTPEEIDGKRYFNYRHVVRGEQVWFAYDLPYTPKQVGTLLTQARKNSHVEVLELCKTRKDRPVHALRFSGSGGDNNKYGIWLQARAHAFESGASWVLHELALWLLSDEPSANSLRNAATVTVVPIVDVDGVVEGRTGKNQYPYDQNRGWNEAPNHWPEIRSIQSRLAEMASQNQLDMFVDFHGPANQHHPYFIVPESDSLPYEKQRANRANFFKILNCKKLSSEAILSQSMTEIYYSARRWDRSINNSCEWVVLKTTDHNIAMTLEVNMNTPLSTRDGYEAEAKVLGRAISKYFVSGQHKR